MLGGRSRRSLGGSATAVRITAILTAVGCCLAAAAYATTRSVVSSGSPLGRERTPLRPRIFGHPDQVSMKTTAWFAFAQPGRPARWSRPGPPLRMECKLDAAPWAPCVAPVTLSGIARGAHRFAVHAVNQAGKVGPAAEFAWWRARSTGRVVSPVPAPEDHQRRPLPARPVPAPQPAPEEPAETTPVEEPETPVNGPPFTIRQIGGLGELYPGAPAQTIAVLIENPNKDAITVTSLTASIATDPPGCPAMENFILIPAAVTPAAPVVVAGESTLSLPEVGIVGPQIAMADLPHSQDACEGDELQIALSGESN